MKRVKTTFGGGNNEAFVCSPLPPEEESKVVYEVKERPDGP